MNETISLIPSDPIAIAKWIWEQQDKLNAAALGGVGTIAVGKLPKEQSKITTLKFYRALADEVTENMHNYFWKHWSKEAKDGKYFQLIDPQEDSKQNVKVELVDIIFFTVSILQTFSAEDLWVDIWSDSWEWNLSNRYGNNYTDREFTPIKNEEVVNLTFELQSCLWNTIQTRVNDNTTKNNDEIVTALRALIKACAINFTFKEIVEAYEKKLAINFARLERGRLQVGDTLSEIENKTI